jgi:hypothetical protein
MNSKLGYFKLLMSLMAAFTSVAALSQTTLDGMSRVGDWTDLETTSNEMPAQIWGACDATTQDRVGIKVEFSNGTSGTATYSGVSGVWNTSGFPGINPDSATGVFASCTGLHFLNNNNSTLPMAWENCSMPFSSNFDLDYSEANGSQFRASTTGWVSAHIQTYCGAGVAPPALSTEIPTLSIYGLVLTTLGLLLVATRRLRQSFERG